MIDPAYGMPAVNWRQQGSFVSAAPVFTDDPGVAPYVCIPPIRAEYLPYVLGCLDQLLNPSSYDSTDPATILLAVERAQLLKSIVAHATPCEERIVQLRVDSCQLQSSTDGVTWTEVPGWDTVLGSCLPSAVAAQTQNIDQALVATPLNPLGLTSTALACSIAAYVAQQILQGTLQQLATELNEARTVIQFVTDLSAGGLLFRSVFPYTTAALLAVDALFAWGTSVGFSVASSVASDPVFWDDIKCAIFVAIQSDGAITASNWPSAVANIGGISYSVPGAAGAVSDYVGGLDLAHVMEWQQLAGLDSADCSDCISWCRTFDFTALGAITPFTSAGYGTLVGGQGYIGTSFAGYDAAGLALAFASTHIDSVRYIGVLGVENAASTRSIQNTSGGTVVDLGSGSGAFDVTWSPNASITGFNLYATSHGATIGSDKIQSCTIRGKGTNPFGTSNC